MIALTAARLPGVSLPTLLELQERGFRVVMIDARSALIDGLSVQVLDEAEAARVERVVCASTSDRVDDVRTHCGLCGAPIIHRPYVPALPMKVCVTCSVRASVARVLA